MAAEGGLIAKKKKKKGGEEREPAKIGARKLVLLQKCV